MNGGYRAGNSGSVGGSDRGHRRSDASRLAWRNKNGSGCCDGGSIRGALRSQLLGGVCQSTDITAFSESLSKGACVALCTLRRCSLLCGNRLCLDGLLREVLRDGRVGRGEEDEGREHAGRWKEGAAQVHRNN